LYLDDLGAERSGEVRGEGLSDEGAAGEDLQPLEGAERLRDESVGRRHERTSHLSGPRDRGVSRANGKTSGSQPTTGSLCPTRGSGGTIRIRCAFVFAQRGIGLSREAPRLGAAAVL